MMVDLKVMAYFKTSLSTRNWDSAIFMVAVQPVMETLCRQRKVVNMVAPYGTCSPSSKEP
ncbi:hypothetical protein [Aeromonas enteropelogenes]|uniref:hypothetical protein n=1 Tax=Aeromonas enteropelogenes TaxID=29489 RepID=UPI000F53F5C0|nr:hypothetical protein [Aeromonas enteropelogenes]RQM66897.1 hypothetical protein EHZ64_07210 [Aeromonas enteropelogenes]